jgi:CHAT domain-containing protein
MAVGVPSAPPSVRRPPPGPGVPAGPARNGLARIVFYVLEDKTAVFAVSRNGIVRGHVAPIGRNELAARVAALRSALRIDDRDRGAMMLFGASGAPPSSPATSEALLSALYRDLVEPVAAALPRAGEHLVVEPHDALWLVPFAALRRPDGSWLGDRWPLLYAPSEEVLEEVRRRPRDRSRRRDQFSALVVGNPLAAPITTGVRGLRFKFDPLPGATDEARTIHSLFHKSASRLLTSTAADLGAVLADIEGQDVVHLATHGIALPDEPLDSFVVLAPSRRCGDLLTARQVTLLSLRADLVVLSACQTGLGRATADGMVGLARSFLAAGARTVVVSLWNVSDRATAELMKAYYREYLRGADKASALQKAVKALRPTFPDPQQWAPFVVFGAES